MAYDYLLVGGGLQNGLIALGLRTYAPQATIAMVEQDGAIGGNHAWSFHDSDVPEGARAFVEPLVEQRWAAYDVVFPGFERRLDMPYASFSSTRLDRAVREAFAGAPACALHLGARARAWDAGSVTLVDGQRLEGRAVIVARGPEQLGPLAGSGFLKFYGIEMRLAAPSGLERPIVMDATCAQRDGFRFFYLLPYAPDVVLVEDNYFSDDAELDRAKLRLAVLEEARARGFRPAEILREEHGVLPLPWRDPPSHADATGGAPETADFRGPLVAGYQGGFFHPGTSYSLPIAARLAAHVAHTPIEQLFGEGLRALVRKQRRQAAFARHLNWMLFRTAPSANRWRIMGGFYRHPADLLQRFYSLRLTTADRFRILALGGMFWTGALVLPRAPNDG